MLSVYHQFKVYVKVIWLDVSFGFLFLFLFFFQKGINELSSQHLFGKRSKWYETVCTCMFFSLSGVSALLSLLLKEEIPLGSQWREVSEIQAHSHGFCLSHPAFYVWRLCKLCACSACVYYTCHHGRMVVTSPTCSSWGTCLKCSWPLSSPWQQDQGWGTGLC